MKLTVIAVGNSRNSYEMKLFQYYARRITFPFNLIEVVAKKSFVGNQRKVKESSLLLSKVSNDSIVIVLDQCGLQQTSQKLAAQIQSWRDEGTKELTFLIGGADGLDKAIFERAHMVLSFGAQTWPHLLVRVLLAEQVYRVQCIISGHPYHRV